MRDDLSGRPGDYAGPLDLPDHDHVADEAYAPSGPSLLDEVSGLFGDGKTYVEAEIAFQKSRLAYVADGSKGVAVYALAALAFLHLALIALVVGLVIALAPLIGPWGAMALVVVLLLAGAVFFALKLRTRAAAIGDAFSDTRP